jgi:hypothetical protein
MAFSKIFAPLLYSGLELIIGAQQFTLVSTLFCNQVNIFQFYFVLFILYVDCKEREALFFP